MLRRTLFISVALAIATAAQFAQSPGHGDNSDWWSLLRSDSAGLGIRAQHRKPALSNFRILGFAAGTPFEEIAAKLGHVTDVQRGDASTGRDQICYVSPAGDVHLIFELGEVEGAFYLFENGPKWEGENFCARSTKVAKSLTTTSGLRLGMNPAEVEKILGKPSSIAKNKLIYDFEFRKKTSPQDLKKFRESDPGMSDQEFRKNYEFSDVTDYIEARFTDSKLTYLAISNSDVF
jgi:hypothetical protein